LPRVLIDADGCPVKEEVYRVAARYELEVKVVSNTWMRVPDQDRIELVVVGDRFDAADDWIVEQAGVGDIVISADIPLASRCLETGARVLGPTGRSFDQDNIGDLMASRDLMSQLRDMGTVTGGPAPFARKDRSRFLQRLDETVQAVLRTGR
jgi:uncharacterized protein YaiI (UPF0178 family)